MNWSCEGELASQAIDARFKRPERQLPNVLRSIYRIIGDQQRCVVRREAFRQHEDRFAPDEVEDHQEPLVLQLPGESVRSEEHTSELQSRQYLVCRLLLEKKYMLLAERSRLTY